MRDKPRLSQSMHVEQLRSAVLRLLVMRQECGDQLVFVRGYQWTQLVKMSSPRTEIYNFWNRYQAAISVA